MERQTNHPSPECSPLQEAYDALCSAIDEETKIMKSIEQIMDTSSSPTEASRKMQESKYVVLLHEAMRKSKTAFDAWYEIFNSSIL